MGKGALLLTLILVRSTSLFASGAGASAAAFLKIDPAARPAALGGAFSSYSGDPNLISYNPAGIAWVEEPSASLAHSRYLEDINHEWLVYAQPYKKIGVSAIAVNFLTVGPMDGYDAADTPTDPVTSSDMALNIAHAAYMGFDSNPVFKEIGAGLNLKYIRERLDGDTAAAFAADLGVLVKPRVSGLNIGLAVQNLGSRVKFIDEGYSLPRRAKIGFALKRRLVGIQGFPSTLSGEAVFPHGEDAYLCAGLEQPVDKRVVLRLGWDNRRDIGSPFSFGLGLMLGSLTRRWKDIDLDIDYSYSNYGDLGNVHKFGLTARFGSDSINSGSFGTIYIQ